MRCLRFEAQLNPARDVSARRKRQRIEFEIGIAEAFVADGRAHGINRQNGAKGRETQHDKDAWVTIMQQHRDFPKEKRKRDEITERRGDPGGDVAFLAYTFGALRSPIRTPQPGRKRIGFLECS